MGLGGGWKVMVDEGGGPWGSVGSEEGRGRSFEAVLAESFDVIGDVVDVVGFLVFGLEGVWWGRRWWGDGAWV